MLVRSRRGTPRAVLLKSGARSIETWYVRYPPQVSPNSRNPRIPMSSTYRKPVFAKDWTPPRRRRSKQQRPAVDLERLQRDFWLHFDLEKFAMDWRRGLGKRAS